MNGISVARENAPGVPFAARMLFNMLSGLRCGSLDLVCPDRRRLAFRGPAPGPHAYLELHDWAVCGEVLRRGDIGFAECWIDGRWATDDLDALLLLAALNQDTIARALHGTWWATLASRLRHLFRANTRGGSRRNIHAHYDLGNDFYALWLDGTMTYSSALFGGDMALDLHAAQQAKYGRILDTLRVAPGGELLEIGCGWGGFAEFAAARGYRVTGITVSQAQLDYARSRIAHAGLADRVSLELRDYRDVAGRYDGVVSIEMFEAVGERYWAEYFRRLRGAMKAGATALVQTITIAEHKFERYRSGTDFIQRYIFPGGMLPSVQRFAGLAAQAGLTVADCHRFGADYAETLRRWHRAFMTAGDAVRALGFDECFMRLWRFYLSYCEAGFRSGSTDVIQVALAGR